MLIGRRVVVVCVLLFVVLHAVVLLDVAAEDVKAEAVAWRGRGWWRGKIEGILPQEGDQVDGMTGKDSGGAEEKDAVLSEVADSGLTTKQDAEDVAAAGTDLAVGAKTLEDNAAGGAGRNGSGAVKPARAAVSSAQDSGPPKAAGSNGGVGEGANVSTSPAAAPGSSGHEESATESLRQTTDTINKPLGDTTTTFSTTPKNQPENTEGKGKTDMADIVPPKKEENTNTDTKSGETGMPENEPQKEGTKTEASLRIETVKSEDTVMVHAPLVYFLLLFAMAWVSM